MSTLTKLQELLTAVRVVVQFSFNVALQLLKKFFCSTSIILLSIVMSSIVICSSLSPATVIVFVVSAVSAMISSSPVSASAATRTFEVRVTTFEAVVSTVLVRSSGKNYLKSRKQNRQDKLTFLNFKRLFKCLYSGAVQTFSNMPHAVGLY